ncbi:MAG: iron export ABC transporter permease subunit FetB [Sphingomonadaceae bacterium]
MSAPLLGFWELAAAAVLVVINAALSLLLSLGFERALIIAAVRAAVQLLLVGLVLRTVFELGSPLLVGGIVLFMLVTASYEIASRQERRFAGFWGFGVGAGAATVATLIVATFALISLQPDPWFSPATVIPLVGIMLGTVMNGVSISLNAFNTGVVREHAVIDARLALGADRDIALKPLQRSAIRAGMIPIINSMSAAGIVTLPGMMTGQILAGMPPFEAAKYQILILFLLSAAAGFGALAATYVAVRRISDDRDRLRLDRLAQG